MNQQELIDILKPCVEGRSYSGCLTPYAIQSIEQNRSNYPVSNLMAYCDGYGLKIVMTDLATEDRFCPKTILDIHKVLGLLMQRYDVDSQLVYRKTAAHYSRPKEDGSNKKYNTSLSIKTLLAVCEVIHCELSFELK